MKKRIISLLLAIVMVVSLFPVTVSAAADPLNALSTLSGSTELPVKKLTGTAGQTLSSGIYYVESSMTINDNKSANNGLAVASGATVYLYIPKGVTLTVYGKNGTANASAGGAATAPTLKVITSDSYSYKDKSGTSKATGARVYIDRSTAAGSAGSTGGSAGYAAIYVPSNAKLAVFGEGTLNAIGGKGGAGASGGAGAMTAHGATTMRMYDTKKNGEGTYWMTYAGHTSTDGTSFSLTWVQKHPRFYSNKNMRLYGGAGGGGGAGAGGGGAAIGTNGTAGAAGTVGATPVVKESTNSTHTFYNYTTPDIAKATAASAAAAATAAGTIYIASTVNTSGSKAGAGGAAGSGSAATSKINSYTRSVFTGWESANSKANTVFQIADGQKGGAGGAGGAGAVFGKGGQGGQGGTGGDGGLAANTSTTPSAAPKSGANGAAGATGSSTKQTLAAANMPYYTVTFTGAASNGTQKFYLAQGTKITAPANNTANFIGWKVTSGASAPLSTVFGSGSALLSGDTKIYKAGEAIVLGKGTMGNVTLSAVYKTPVAITITAPGATYDGTPYDSASVTADQSYDVEKLVKSYEGVNGTIYGPTPTPPINAGSYKLTVSVPDSDANYIGSADKPFTISPITLTDPISDIPAQNYTGSAVTPKLTVKDGSKELTEGVDYTVTYENNVDESSAAKATVTFKGNYTGTAEKTFTIKRLPPAVGEGFTIDYLNETITVLEGYTVLKKDGTELKTGAKIEPEQKLDVKKGSSETTENTLPARPETPNAPELSSRTDVSIALIAKDGQAYQYKLTGEQVYSAGQDSAVFSELTKNTAYDFVTYIKATDHSFKSLPSSAASFTTFDTVDSWQVQTSDGAKSSIMINLVDDYTMPNEEQDEFVDDQVAYFTSTETSVDFDVYFWDNSGAAEKKSLIQAAQEDAEATKKEITDPATVSEVTTGVTANGIPYAYYTAVEKSDNKWYQTRNYIFPDANGNNYVEIVFWMSGAEATSADEAAVNSIVDRISTTAKYAVTITVQGADVTYGDSYNVTVTKAELKEYGIDVTPSYTYTYKQNSQTLDAKPVNAGDYTAVVAVDDNDPIYTTAETENNGVAAIKISPKTLTADNIEAIAPVIYNGSAHTPAVTVKDGSKTLVPGTDYTVTYTNNTNAGPATVTVTGTGNYTGAPTKNFTIHPKGTLTDAAIQPDTLSAVTFTGNAMEPKEAITVKDGDKPLTDGTDYDISYTDNTHAGVATVVVTLKGNYSGTLTKTFTIDKKTLTSDMVTVTLPDNHYTGETLTPAVEVKCGSTVLIPGTDYTFESDSQNSGTNAGTYTVKLTGTGDYQGTITKTWTIEKANQAAPEEGVGFSVNYLTDEKITVADGYEVFIKKDGQNVAVKTGDPAIPGETYYVRKAGSDNYNPSPLTANELPERPETPDAPELDYRNGVKIILAAEENVSYKMDNGEWQEDATFTVTDTAKHSFTAYIPATDHSFKSEVSQASAYSACGKLDEVGEIVLNDGTANTLSIKAPNYYIGENGQEDTFDESQTGYYFIGENKAEFNAKVDFDTYWWDNTEDKYTLAEAIAEEMEGEATFETINNIPVAWYEMEETFGDESYTTRTYIIADSNKEFVEIVFWKSGVDADDQIAAIINTLSTTRTFTVLYDGKLFSDAVPYNTPLTKPAPDPTKEGHVFLGWYADENCTQAWNFDNDTVLQDLDLHSGWAKDTDPVSGISGKVTMDNAPVAGAVVELWRGVDKVAATVTDANGDYTFNHVEDGIYDVVAAKDFSGDVKTKTKMVTVPDNTPGAGDIQLPSKSVNSILEHTEDELPENAKGDILHITAAGIDNIAESKNPASGEHYTIKLTVTPGASEASEQAAIQSLAAGRNVEYLELTLTETYVNDGDETLNRTDEDIGDSNTQLLTVCVPFDFSGVVQNSIQVYRYHGTSVDVLTTTPDLTTGEYIEISTDCVIIHAKKFSTYAIGYEQESYYPGGSETTYAITGANTENGKLTVSTKYAKAGQTVTITATPDESYKLNTLTVKDAKGNVLTLTKVSDTTYTFKMPSSGVSVSAAFAKLGACPQDETCVYAKFTDADTKAWYHDGVHFCVENGYMVGVAADKFAPSGTLSRAMIVTMLWRMEGELVANYAMSFEDVAADQWYTEAIRWAQSTGVVLGYDAEHFGTDDDVTREQLAAILMRYAAFKGIDVSRRNDLNRFTDKNTVSGWALENVKWANAVGIINGRTETTIVPTGNATRAEAACMVQRFCETVLK